MRVRSRISGRTSELLAGSVVPDQFVRDDPAHTRLVPDGTAEPLAYLGRWPEPLDLEMVEQVAHQLADATAWSDRVAVLPLVPAIDAAVRLSPLDRHILGDLAHLQFVCKRPRLNLKIEEERLPIARARRFPERSTAALVAHPEDWEHRTLSSIRPARVLAIQIEDEWDLYENRVAVRLVDHLLAYLGRRVDTLRKIQRTYEEGEDFADETRGSHRRGRRLFTLWGRLFTAPSLHDELMISLRLLARAQRDLQALLDTRLYQHIPRSTSVAVALRPTNILTNDPHYRKVADLWRAWARDGHIRRPSRAELARTRQRQCRAFDAFAELVVLRALHDLGYAPVDSAVPGPTFDLRGPYSSLTVTHDVAGVLSLVAHGQRLRVVPLLGRLTTQDLPGIWSALAGDADPTTLILALGRPHDSLAHEAPALARALAGWSAPRFVLISPWSIDSVERTARALSLWLAAGISPNYPPTTTLRPKPQADLPSWIHVHLESYRVVAPATDSEILAFQAACAARTTALQDQQQQARVRRLQFDPSELHSLAQLSHLADRARSLAPFTRCPVCDHPNNAFEPRVAVEPATWWSVCSACDAQWGTRRCNACRMAYPILVHPMKLGAPADDPPSPDWIDRAYGRDIWAEPCWRPQRATFRCSACGVCDGGTCSQCPSGRNDTHRDSILIEETQ